MCYKDKASKVGCLCVWVMAGQALACHYNWWTGQHAAVDGPADITGNDKSHPVTSSKGSAAIG